MLFDKGMAVLGFAFLICLTSFVGWVFLHSLWVGDWPTALSFGFLQFADLVLWLLVVDGITSKV